MKYKILFLFVFIASCTPQSTYLSTSKSYNAKGLAYIYNDYDYSVKIIKGKMDNKILQLSHQNLRTGALIKIINPQNKESIVLKNERRIKYPDFYKILITDALAKKLNLNSELPLVEILEIKKNKSFIAKKAKISNEEKKVPSNAPVASVKISNISKEKEKKIVNKTNQIYIHIASFYSPKTASFLKQRIIDEVSQYDDKKIKIKKINNKETQVISGPYKSINLLKNDYIMLKSFGFEELDIFINE